MFQLSRYRGTALKVSLYFSLSSCEVVANLLHSREGVVWCVYVRGMVEDANSVVSNLFFDFQGQGLVG